MKYSAFIVAFVLLFAFPLFADEDHHEDLTPDQLGTVHFPVSCSPSAQRTFERGVALLHSFWYEEAEKDFAQIAQDDPQCAMAQWGLAMSQWHQLWNHPDAATIKKGEREIKMGEAEIKKGKSLQPKTDRERDYLAALGEFYSSSGKLDHQARADAYSHAMEAVYQHYPDDREAAIFYSLSLLASAPDGDTTFVNRKKAAAILETLFAVIPDHPGVAHYLIHSYDKPQLAQLGLPAARRYAQIAPAAPHALHMPSHIFARLGLWQDDVNSNLASIAATKKTAAMHMGGEGHQFHAMDFLVYAYLQSGREADAQHVIDEVKAMSPMKDMYGLGFDPRISSLVSFPAKYDLELHHWAAAAALVPVAGADIGDNAITYWARAIGAARSGNLDQARKDLSEIEAIHQALMAKKHGESYPEAVEQDEQEAAAWIAHAEGKNDEAMRLLRTIAEREEATGDEPIAIPAREMLADLLLDMNRPEPALVEFQADLKFNPNRFDGLYGAAHAAEMAGKGDAANTYYAQLVKSCDGSNSDRPELGRARAQLAKKGAETASASQR
jgi:tetratricopeptide (TPR) repeat protein